MPDRNRLSAWSNRPPEFEALRAQQARERQDLIKRAQEGDPVAAGDLGQVHTTIDIAPPDGFVPLGPGTGRPTKRNGGYK